jgi:hypothetical protein
MLGCAKLCLELETYYVITESLAQTGCVPRLFDHTADLVIDSQHRAYTGCRLRNWQIWWPQPSGFQRRRQFLSVTSVSLIPVANDERLCLPELFYK